MHPVIVAALYIAVAASAGLFILFLSWFFSKSLGYYEKKKGKNDPWECGVPPLDTNRERISVKFFLVAVLFILFDIEIVFLIPWAIAFNRAARMPSDSGYETHPDAWPILLQGIIFIGILALGLWYEIARGGMTWERSEP
jgi:NADH-quinone oxidoreductase subunit A